MIIAIFVLGLSVGSFLNMLTVRLATSESLKVQRSYCPHCRATLAAKDLIPVFSFLWLKGKCRYCRAPISWQYPLVELATAVLFVFVFMRFTPTLIANESWGLSPFILLRDLIFTAGLITLFVLDFRWYIVPDEVTIPLIVFAFVINIVLGMSLVSLGLGMAIGGGLYFLLWFVSGGQWVGSGDIRLGLLLGAMLGAASTLIALWIAYVIGGAVAAFFLVTGRMGLKSKLPMGTFLALGAYMALLFSGSFIRLFAF